MVPKTRIVDKAVYGDAFFHTKIKDIEGCTFPREIRGTDPDRDAICLFKVAFELIEPTLISCDNYKVVAVLRKDL